jgi:peptidyl-prolyl cis-trans isomerase C
MISINGTPIPEQAIAAEMQYHPAPTREQAWQEAATALAIRALLLNEAARLGMQDADDEEATIRALLAQEVPMPEPDEVACRRYHAANRARFRGPDLYEAAHILLAAPSDDAAARAQAKETAVSLLAILRDAPQRFADLARAHSACPSSAKGGQLGQQTRGDLVPEIETFIMALEEGQICPTPVGSRYGFHVLRLDRRVIGAELPYEAIAETVALRMAAQTWQRAVSQYLRVLAGQAHVEGLALDGATTPLVQ